jgi:outer membrane protein assembly factor BamD
MKKALLGLVLLMAACASRRDVDIGSTAGRTDRLVWEEAQKAREKRRWMEARQHYKRIVDAFPNSEFAPDARLGMGDSYFYEGGLGNYVLAISEYRQFLTVYPSNPKNLYAQYMVAESYFKQKHGADRDQTPTQQALEEYQKLVHVAPDSEWGKKAQTRVDECRQILARSEFLVGLFYQRTRQACRSAVLRYQGILKDYPDYAQIDEVLFRLGECLALSGRKAEAEPELQKLVANHPNSPFVSEARELIQKLAEAPPERPPAPRPTEAPLK